jgi:muramoyltetrapeptide carboxypeptidase
MGWLARRYRLRFDRSLFTRRGYLAGTDERRREELAGALADPTVRAIFAARGGYGASRVAHTLDWVSLLYSPRWIVGFSDITVLHVHASRAGVASLHACHVAELGRANERARGALVAALEQPLGVRVFSGLSTYREGVAEGPLFGGNLAMLYDCAAAGHLEVPRACVLLLEDVSERPYRVDRMLTALIAGGHLLRAAAVVVGDFTQCSSGPDGVTVSDVLRERLSVLGVPVVAGIPVGHDLRNEPMVLGGFARVAADRAHATLRVGGEPPGGF